MKGRRSKTSRQRTPAVKGPHKGQGLKAEQKLSERGMTAFAHLAATDPSFKILVLIPHDTQDLSKSSLFGWYTPGLHMAAAPLLAAAALPADVREPYTDLRSVLSHRLSRRVWPHVTPIQLDALLHDAPYLQCPFRIFLSNDTFVASAIDDFVRGEKWPCLHVSSIPGYGRILHRDLNVDRLLEYCKTVLDAVAKEPGTTAVASSVKREMPEQRRRPLRSHRLPRGLHNVTDPNEIALTAYGWAFHREDPISAPVTPGGHDPQRYVDRICRSADAVFSERARLVRHLRPDLIDYRYIIAVQSLYWGHFANWRKRARTFEHEEHAKLRSAYQLAVRATTYFDTLESEEALKSEAYRTLAAMRAADARSFTAGLSALAAGSLAPVLRLEPKLNQVRGDLKQLAACVRANAKHHSAWKQSRMTWSLGQRMRALVNRSFLHRIDRQEYGPIEGLKLVSDLPLELMHSGDLPISLRFDVSRVPVVPGNLYISMTLMPPIFLPLLAFEEVLVVRSFRPNDPLRQVLEVSIAAALPDAPSSVCARFVDVATEDDFIAAVESFGGAVMIFDGHGTFDDGIGSGTIVIGGKAVDVWEMRRRCTVPPIVIFSACDTQPLDGSHSSVATAAFVLGAHTVLATTLPIDGRQAGVFIGRLLFRMSEFIPLAVKLRPVFTWREVVSGMLRMTHITEVITALHRYAGAAYERLDARAIQLKANIAINQRRPDWYRIVLRALAEATDQPMHKTQQDIRMWASMTDSLKYVQLGHPESVVIVEEDARAAFEAEAARSKARAVGPA